MARIAIVTYFFPPGDEIGGLRPSALARNLASMGHDVVVITHQSDPVEAGYRAVHVTGRARRARAGTAVTGGVARQGATTGLKGLARKLMAVPDGKTRWARHASRALRVEVESRALDAVITTGPPHSVHLAALWGLGFRRAGRPRWIVDLRDLWTDNPYYDYGAARRRVDRRIESVVMRQADAVTTTTAGFARSLKARHAVEARRILTGFDDTAPPPVRAPHAPPLRVVHAGNLYAGRRDPRPLLEAAGELVRAGRVDGSALKLVFIGPDLESVAEAAASYGAADIVETHPPMSHGEVMHHLERAAALLIVQWRSDLTATEVPGKIFEYLACRTPIIALGSAPEGEVADILRETGAGRVVNSVSECREALESLLEGGLPDPDESRLAAFGQRQMALEFARVIDGAEVMPG
jgi:glycosyltransferase involved in cell wall biosynthesis